MQILEPILRKKTYLDSGPEAIRQSAREAANYLVLNDYHTSNMRGTQDFEIS
jgi:hypothetical protein